MRTKELGPRLSLAALLALSPLVVSPASAEDCVRVVRSISNFDIRGDAWTWWSSAEGDYARDHDPAHGAVLVFKKSGRMSRGHVSLVSSVLDSRTILVDHSWLGGRGLRRGMKVVDVSANNDWTQVRVWHEPTRQVGQKVYPTYGFILPDGARPSNRQPELRYAVAPRGRGAAPAVEMRTAALKIVPPHKPGLAAGMMVASFQPDETPLRLKGEVRTMTPPRKPGAFLAALTAEAPFESAVTAVLPPRKPSAGPIHATTVAALPEDAESVSGLIPARKPMTAAMAVAAVTAPVMPVSVAMMPARKPVPAVKGGAVSQMVATIDGLRVTLPSRKPGSPILDDEQVAAVEPFTR